MHAGGLCSRSLSGAIATSVALAVAFPTGLFPRTATAGPAAEEPDLDAADEAALAEAHALYDEGKAKFDTFDYEGAVDLWTKAYAEVPENTPGVRNAMVYNIATAQEKAYEVDKDPQHLRQATLLLESYIKNYKAIYKRTPETQAEVDKAKERIAALNERIAKAERGEDSTPTQPGESGTNATYLNQVDGIQWNTGHNPPADPELLERNKKLAREGKKTDAMLIAGYVVGSIGLLFLLGAAGGFGASAAADETSDGDDARRAGRTTGYVGLALGLGGVVTGATLIGVGFSRRKKHQRGELGVAPVLTPKLAGANLVVRF